MNGFYRRDSRIYKSDEFPIRPLQISSIKEVIQQTPIFRRVLNQVISDKNERTRRKIQEEDFKKYMADVATATAVATDYITKQDLARTNFNAYIDSSKKSLRDDFGDALNDTKVAGMQMKDKTMKIASTLYRKYASPQFGGYKIHYPTMSMYQPWPSVSGGGGGG